MQNAATSSDDVFKAENVDLTAATISTKQLSAISASVSGLPVAGYKPTQPQWALDLVNENKVLEEKVLRQIDKHTWTANLDGIDQRAVALARTKIQEAFMWLNRGVFQPQRIEGDL